MIAGIDFAGTVETSSHPRLEAGRQGHPQRLGLWRNASRRLCARRRASKATGWCRCRQTMSARDAMAIGTAGYTAMLAVMALERHGLDPPSGPIAVTGAAGGVGSVAIAHPRQARLHRHAVTGRPQEADYLKALGAAEIIERKELAGPAKPLAKERWAGGIDAVGSTTLANLLSMTRYGGAVAACGLAGGMDLPTSVAPFILRGVCLYGIDSVMCPIERRREAWKRLETDLDRQKLAAMTREIGLSDVLEVGPGRSWQGQVRGRIVVKIG